MSAIAINKWLPIGSIVHLDNYDGLLMIISYMVSSEDDGVYWDYAAVPYPQGLVGPEGHVLFDRDVIDDILYLGFRNDEGELYRDALNELLVEFGSKKEASRNN